MKKLFLFFLTLTIINSCKKKIQTDYTNGQDNFNYAKARKLRDSMKIDSAYYFYNLAKDDYKKMGDSLGIAQSLINMGIIQTNRGDFYGGIETSLEAEKYLRNDNDINVKANLARNFNNMAIASSFLYNYNDAIKFYQNTLKYTKDKNDRAVYYNNIGKVLTNMKEYTKAKYYLELSLNTTSNTMDYARSLSNLSAAKYLSDKNDDPLKDYLRALDIRYRSKNITEMNSSYATLSDYYSDKDIDSAKLYAEKMYSTSKQIKNPEDQLQALQKLINLDKNNYLKYFNAFQNINDSVIIARGKAKNQFALIKSDIDKTESKNIELQAKNLEAENKVLYRNMIVASLLLTLIIGVIWYTKRKKRLQKEKELEVKNTELKYSKKVHDVVANGIYQVMTKLENHLDISRNETLDDLEYIYNRSRNLSYENIEINDESEIFSEKIRKLMGYFTSDHIDTILIGNDVEVWENISHSCKAEVYQVLRELLINMKKHSHADRVTLKFERTFEKVKIHYSDTGVGINNETILKNGVRNMINRIENLGGCITFENKTQTEKGMIIHFSFPFS